MHIPQTTPSFELLAIARKESLDLQKFHEFRPNLWHLYSIYQMKSDEIMITLFLF